MIIVLTNKTDYTVDYAILRMLERGVGFVRMNTEDAFHDLTFVWSSAGGTGGRYLIVNDKIVQAKDVSAVWYRRPIPPVPPRNIPSRHRALAISELEATLNGFLMCLPCVWINEPYAVRRAELRLYQLDAAEETGFVVPGTVVTNRSEEAQSFYEAHGGAVVCKAIGRGTFTSHRRNWVIFTNLVTADHMRLARLVRSVPTCFQRYLSASVEVRVTVFGTRVFATEIVVPDRRQGCDWRRHHEMATYRSWTLPDTIEDKCRALVSALGLEFGAIDLLVDSSGTYHFLEINPNGQWAWLEQATGQPMRDALIDLANGETSLGQKTAYRSDLGFLRSKD